MDAEERAKYRTELEGNPVFQEMRLELEALRERNLILINIARDHCPDKNSMLFIHMQPDRMAEREPVKEIKVIVPRCVNIYYDSNDRVFGIEILDVPPLASAQAFDAVEKHWRDG